MNDYNQNIPTQNNAGSTQAPQISYGAGSPESGPLPSAKEPSSESQQVEYGYDQIKKIESAAEQIKTAERKEDPFASRPPVPPKQNVQPKDLSKVPVPAVKPQGPKFFGYKIPPYLATNFQLIKANKGKGDPKQGKTWMYVLLDRMLKKESL